jgi:hypothetical protein
MMTSRMTAAKGTRLLGVRAVVGGFERDTIQSDRDGQAALFGPRRRQRAVTCSKAPGDST